MLVDIPFNTSPPNSLHANAQEATLMRCESATDEETTLGLQECSTYYGLSIYHPPVSSTVDITDSNLQRKRKLPLSPSLSTVGGITTLESPYEVTSTRYLTNQLPREDAYTHFARNELKFNTFSSNLGKFEVDNVAVNRISHRDTLASPYLSVLLPPVSRQVTSVAIQLLPQMLRNYDVSSNFTPEKKSSQLQYHVVYPQKIMTSLENQNIPSSDEVSATRSSNVVIHPILGTSCSGSDAPCKTWHKDSGKGFHYIQASSHQVLYSEDLTSSDLGGLLGFAACLLAEEARIVQHEVKLTRAAIFHNDRIAGHVAMETIRCFYDDRPFLCDRCGMRWKTAAARSAHLLYHEATSFLQKKKYNGTILGKGGLNQGLRNGIDGKKKYAVFREVWRSQSLWCKDTSFYSIGGNLSHDRGGLKLPREERLWPYVNSEFAEYTNSLKNLMKSFLKDGRWGLPRNSADEEELISSPLWIPYAAFNVFEIEANLLGLVAPKKSDYNDLTVDSTDYSYKDWDVSDKIFNKIGNDFQDDVDEISNEQDIHESEDFLTSILKLSLSLDSNEESFLGDILKGSEGLVLRSNLTKGDKSLSSCDQVKSNLIPPCKCNDEEIFYEPSTQTVNETVSNAHTSLQVPFINPSYWRISQRFLALLAAREALLSIFPINQQPKIAVSQLPLHQKLKTLSHTHYYSTSDATFSNTANVPIKVRNVVLEASKVPNSQISNETFFLSIEKGRNTMHNCDIDSIQDIIACRNSSSLSSTYICSLCAEPIHCVWSTEFDEWVYVDAIIIDEALDFCLPPRLNSLLKISDDDTENFLFKNFSSTFNEQVNNEIGKYTSFKDSNTHNDGVYEHVRVRNDVVMLEKPLDQYSNALLPQDAKQRQKSSNRGILRSRKPHHYFGDTRRYNSFPTDIFWSLNVDDPAYSMIEIEDDEFSKKFFDYQSSDDLFSDLSFLFSKHNKSLDENKIKADSSLLNDFLDVSQIEYKRIKESRSYRNKRVYFSSDFLMRISSPSYYYKPEKTHYKLFPRKKRRKIKQDKKESSIFNRHSLSLPENENEVLQNQDKKAQVDGTISCSEVLLESSIDAIKPKIVDGELSIFNEGVESKAADIVATEAGKSSEVELKMEESQNGAPLSSSYTPSYMQDYPLDNVLQHTDHRTLLPTERQQQLYSLDVAWQQCVQSDFQSSLDTQALLGSIYPPYMHGVSSNSKSIPGMIVVHRECWNTYNSMFSSNSVVASENIVNSNVKYLENFPVKRISKYSINVDCSVKDFNNLFQDTDIGKKYSVERVASLNGFMNVKRGLHGNLSNFDEVDETENKANFENFCIKHAEKRNKRRF